LVVDIAALIQIPELKAQLVVLVVVLQLVITNQQMWQGGLELQGKVIMLVFH